MKSRNRCDKRNPLLITPLWILLFTIIYHHANGQAIRQESEVKTDSIQHTLKQNDIAKPYDFGDLTYHLLHRHKKPDTLRKGSGITIVPNVASNPTIGQQGGIKAVAGIKLGHDSITRLSVAATSASITTKGIIFFYINHNIFTPGNKWNFQGNFAIAKAVTPDFGLGIGKGQDIGSAAETILANPDHKPYIINSYFFTFREKAYKEVAKNFLVGAGVDLSVRWGIKNNDQINNITPSSVYSDQHGFLQSK